ncbi:hypothetical protein BJX65DRAFT_260491 [Aspergillus insuetus]
MSRHARWCSGGGCVKVEAELVRSSSRGGRSKLGRLPRILKRLYSFGLSRSWGFLFVSLVLCSECLYEIHEGRRVEVKISGMGFDV